MTRVPSRRRARSGQGAASGEHPFFRAMVLMGSSIAVGCGGNVKQQESGRIGDGSGGSGGSSNGGSMSGGTSSGGVSVQPAGGTTSRGGATQNGGARSTGGTKSSAGGTTSIMTTASGGTISIVAPDASVAPCAPAQWDCSAIELDCAQVAAGYRIPSTPCACDSKRPISPEDCPAGQKRLCQTFVRDTRGMAISLPFGCTCVAAGPSCETACADTPPARWQNGCISDTADNYLCGCTVVVLR